MISTGTALVGAAALTAGGYFARAGTPQAIPDKYYIGFGALAGGLAVLSEANEEFASRFALLLLVAAVFINVPVLAKKMGYTK